MAKFIVAAILLFCLTSCHCPKVVTLNQYNDIYVGEMQQDLEYNLGKPYRVKDLPEGKKEYIYIERLKISAHKELFRTYYITIQNGKVLSKKMEESKTPSIEFSY